MKIFMKVKLSKSIGLTSVNFMSQDICVSAHNLGAVAILFYHSSYLYLVCINALKTQNPQLRKLRYLYCRELWGWRMQVHA